MEAAEFENKRKKKSRECKMKTLRPSTERRPLRMHSLRPVPSTITSYSSSMAIEGVKKEEAESNPGEVETDLQ